MMASSALVTKWQLGIWSYSTLTAKAPLIMKCALQFKIGLNTFPHKALFLCETRWEKEKLLVTSNFSFSHSVFYPFFRIFLLFSLNLKLSSANCPNLDQSKILLFGKGLSLLCEAEPHSLVRSIVDLRTGGGWFDYRLVQYSLRGLMIVIATWFIPLSPLSVISTIVMWESSQWLGKNIVLSTG